MTRRDALRVLVGAVVLSPKGKCSRRQPGDARTHRELWRAVHLLAPAPEGLPLLARALVEHLVPLGINVLVFEVNYRFAFRSHPELRMEPVLRFEDARALASLCRRYRIRLIPEFNCLGHQSWGAVTFPLLIRYREFDETPDIPLDNPGIYCRSWCPLHPTVNQVVFALIDELVDAFQADAFHVGMDEVFLIASDQCSRCRGKDPAELFAKAVRDYYGHLVKGRGVEMLMWGDRLLEDAVMGYGPEEASRNGTAPAIDRIPRDIIICDWHYGMRREYPSLPYFQRKGFRVLSASWKDERAAVAFLEYARRTATERWLGHLWTTWVDGADLARAALEMEGASEIARQAMGAIRSCAGYGVA